MSNANRKFKNKQDVKSPPMPPRATVPSAPAGWRSKWTGMGRWWNKFWGLTGPISIVISLLIYIAPSIAITPGDNLDPSQEFQTQFVVTNKGNFSLYNVHFTCEIDGSAIAIQNLQGSSSLKRIPHFQSGGLASRGCFAQSRTRTDGRLKVDVYYTWPRFGIERVQPTYFRVESGASGNFLVPDDDDDSSNFHPLIKYVG
jgi:hypothetical protein